MLKRYKCGFCETLPDQISHHKSHLQTQKHSDKKKIFELSLLKYSETELKAKYGATEHELIVENIETILVYEEVFDEKLNIINNIVCDSEEEMSHKQEQIKQSNSVSNKEALKDKIHEIHNYLRNSGAGYGMTALKIFNILYGLKKIEDTNSFELLELKDECKFSYLLELAEENKDEMLAEYIYVNVLDYIYESSPMVKKLIYYDIPKHIKSSVFSHLIKEINKIPMIEKASNVLLSGKIYEYFVGRDQTAISELGAYFTDRHIVDYIYSKVDPEIKEDGTINSMVDMFGGSGGFTTGYIDYLNKKYPDINWKSELDKIYHFDMNNDVIKSAGLEFFCLTGVIPNMDNNIRCINSFKHSFNDRKFFYPITNPPYGGDKRTTTQEALKRKKVKDYIKKELKTLTDEATIHRRQLQLKQNEKTDKKEQKEFDKQKVCLDTCHYTGQKSRIRNFAKKYNIKKGNDKESCSLMLIMDMVELGGTAVGVLKEGVFFNKTYKDLRKVLIENFNVREVISVPSDQFENTSTKTSIVIFDNLGEEKTTNQVVFSDLVVEKFTEDKFEEILGEIALTECKDDFKGVVDKVVSTATREEILTNPICSLNGKDYNKQEIVCGEDYELVKLIKVKKQDGICNYLPKSKRKASFAKDNGNINFYTSSSTIKKCDTADYKDECLVIGTGGNSCIHYNQNEFSCSGDTILIKPIHLDIRFLHYSMLMIWDILLNRMNGSTIKHVTKTLLENLKIPIPKTPEKLQYWVDRISTPYEAKNQKLKEIEELEKKVQDRIQEIMNTEEYEEKELGGICSFKSGKFKSGDCKQIGKYPFYTGKAIQPEGYSDNYCYDNKEYLILLKDGGAGPGVYGEQIGLGKVFYQKGKSAFTCHQLALTLKDNVNILYLYHFLRISKNNIMDLAEYSTGLGTINRSKLSKFKISIPTNPEIIKAMEPDFQRIEQLQGEVKEVEELYQQYIQELAKEAIPPELNQPQEVVVEEVKKEVEPDTISETSSELEEKEEDDNHNNETVKDYSQYTTKELKTFCKERGLKRYSKLKKDELIELLIS
jgi:type I restriction-modification system DNA methylase subunit